MAPRIEAAGTVTRTEFRAVRQGMTSTQVVRAFHPRPVLRKPIRSVARTTITLRVRGCDRCLVQAVQNRRGDLTYATDQVQVDAGEVRWVVPTNRTKSMAFLVYAPFDEIAQGGYPMVVVTGFKGRRPDSHIAPSYPLRSRLVSGCWSGTHQRAITNTLRIRKVRLPNPIAGPGLFDSAAGYLERTLPARPYWVRTKNGARHASDPSICK